MSDGIETLGEAWNAGWGLKARCLHGKIDHGHAARKCDWSYDLDMVSILATRGRDFPLAQMASRLRCPRCGSRNVSVLYITPGSLNRTSARSGYI